MLVATLSLSGCMSTTETQSATESPSDESIADTLNHYEPKTPQLDPIAAPLCEAAAKGLPAKATFRVLKELFDVWDSLETYSCYWNPDGTLMEAQKGFGWRDASTEANDQYFRFMSSFSWDEKVDEACIVSDGARIILIDKTNDRTLDLRPAVYCGFLQ